MDNKDLGVKKAVKRQMTYMGMPRLVVLMLLPGPVFAFYAIGYLTTRDDFRIESIVLLMLAAAYTGWSYRFSVRIAKRLEGNMRKAYMIMVRTGQIVSPIAGVVLAALLFWFD